MEKETFQVININVEWFDFTEQHLLLEESVYTVPGTIDMVETPASLQFVGHNRSTSLQKELLIETSENQRSYK